MTRLITVIVALLAGCGTVESWGAYLEGDGVWTIHCPGADDSTIEIVIEAHHGTEADVTYPPECTLTEMLP